MADPAPESPARRATRQRTPAGRGHPPAGPHPRRRDPRAGGRGRLRAGRAHPQAVGGVPPRRRPRGRPGAQDPAQVALAATRRCSVIRAFTYFSHLANLAEDRHHIRRRADARARRRHAGRQHRSGAGAPALGRHRARKTVSQTLAHSYLSPVLTAHPTEVQRKSILDAERDIAQPADRARRDQGARPAQGRAGAARTGRQRGADPRPRDAAVADAPAALHQAHRGRRDRERAELLRGHLPARDPQALRRPGARAGPAPGGAASCAWASGSAATATAIPTSARRRWNTRCAASARWRCATT